jgi:hypothetical protein
MSRLLALILACRFGVKFSGEFNYTLSSCCLFFIPQRSTRPSVYLLISIVGWLVVGFPVHWFVKKYTNGSYAFYIAIPLIVVVGGLFNNTPQILGLAALFQAFLFRYYLNKKT